MKDKEDYSKAEVVRQQASRLATQSMNMSEFMFSKGKDLVSPVSSKQFQVTDQNIP